MKRIQKDIALADLMPQVIRTRLGSRYWDFYLLSCEWEKIVGEHIAARARPAWIKKNTLWLHVNAPVWSQEIQLIKPELLGKIQDRFPDTVIQDIRCLHKPAAPRQHCAPSKSSKARTLPRQTLDEQNFLKLTNTLPDARVGRALHAFWKKINGIEE